MRIVHVVRQFHPSVGGLETVVTELACAQLAAGHQVQVVTLDRLFATGEPLAATDRFRGIAVIRIPYRGSNRYPVAPSVLHHIQNADIVHVHAIDFFFDYLAWTKPYHRKSLIASTHGAFFHTSFAATLKRIFFNTVTRLSAAWYDAIVAVSATDQELFSKIKSDVECIENGVDIARFLDAAAAAPKKGIISIGRFSSNKRLDRLIAFLAKLRARDPDWKLSIAGRNSDLSAADVASLAADAGLRDAVRIAESASDDSLKNTMHDCSVVASTSDYEGFGLVAIEGMAAGLFPLLSDIPPYRYLVSRTGVGMLADFSNPDEAATNFLLQWGQLTKDYARMRAAAIAAAQPYEWKAVAARYAALYDKVLAGR